jgi:sulfocyanin
MCGGDEPVRNDASMQMNFSKRRLRLRWAHAVCLAVVAAALSAGVTYGAADPTAHFTIIAGKTQLDGGYNFNGYARGGMTVTVPLGWKVAIDFQNAATLAHSMEILPYMAAQPPVPPATPAFPGAATKNLTAGLPKGTKTTVSFIANKPGTYELACGVPAHALAGMWEKFIVSAEVKRPSVTPAAAAKMAVPPQ